MFYNVFQMKQASKEEDRKRRAREADQRRKARKRAQKFGLEGPPLLRDLKPKRSHAKTPQEKALRAEERRAAQNASSAAYRRRYPERRKATMALYREQNRSLISERARLDPNGPDRRRAYKRKRLETDLQFKVRTYLSKRMVRAIRRGNARKSELTIKLVGCSIPDLMAHLEAKFKPGMSWDSWGRWHIDHIRPCASFDLSDPEQQRACFHYTNLQPLWGRENLRKGASWIENVDHSLGAAEKRAREEDVNALT